MKRTFTQNDLQKIATELLQSADSKKGSATIIALSGELGAGKTTLTQVMARILGVKENIISPTFVIMKTYQLKTAYSWKNLVHIDAYRLESSTELEKLGWAELIADPQNLIIVEWPERVPECLTGDVVRVSLSHIDEETREIEIMI